MASDIIQFQLSAPGKTILFGDHSVVYKRRAIATAVNKRTILKFVETKNESIAIKMPHIGLVQSFSTAKIESLLRRNVPVVSEAVFSLSEPKQILHETFVDEICDDISSLSLLALSQQQTSALKSVLYLLRGLLGSVNLDLQGFNIEMSSQIVIGAGMGSSASFAVCLAAGFLHYIRRSFKRSHSGLVNICKSSLAPYIMDLEEPLDEFSNKDKELINSWAYAVERIMHGTPSGLDNTVCTFGALIEMYKDTDQANGKTFNILYNTPELRVLLIDTGVTRVTANLVRKVAALKSNHPQIVEYILNAMGEVACKASNTLQQLNDVKSNLERREKFQVLEELLDINQGLLKTLGVSHPFLDTICDLSIKYGLHSKLTGAGGGGYAYTLLPPDFDELQIAGYCEQLKKIGMQVVDVMLGGQGVRLECIDN